MSLADFNEFAIGLLTVGSLFSILTLYFAIDACHNVLLQKDSNFYKENVIMIFAVYPIASICSLAAIAVPRWVREKRKERKNPLQQHNSITKRGEKVDTGEAWNENTRESSRAHWKKSPCPHSCKSTFLRKSKRHGPLRFAKADENARIIACVFFRQNKHKSVKFRPMYLASPICLLRYICGITNSR